MNFKELQRAEDAAMSEVLTDAGFRRAAAGLWNRRRGDELNVIQLQKHSVKASFCVNLGVHYTFLPKAGIEAALDLDFIEAVDCEIKLRLSEQDAIKDQWWPMVASSVDHVAHLVRRRGFPVFDSYRLDGPISTLDGTRIGSGNSGILSSMTKVRACLLLARMHEHQGNNRECIEFATIGIELAGMGVGPRKALREILRRLGQST